MGPLGQSKHTGLRVRLLALVLVPLLGVAAASGVLLSNQVCSARAASQAESLILQAVALDAMQSSFKKEMLPAFSAEVAVNAPTLFEGASPELLQAVQAITGQVPALRRGTDVALAALARYPAMSTNATRFSTQLTAARAQIDHPGKDQVLTEAASLQAGLAEAENAQVTAATEKGLQVAVLRALRDVDLVQHANEAAASEFLLYSYTQVPAHLDPVVIAAGWAQAFGAAAAAAAAVVDHASAAVVTRWRAVNDSTDISRFNSYLSSQVSPSTIKINIDSLIGLVAQDGARNQAYAQVLQGTFDAAAAAVRAQRHHAEILLSWIIGLVVLLAAISVRVAVRVGRSVTAPLGRLAGQATRISQGELIDVAVTGPREVRTVANALADSVATLRGIQAQAAAVAAGDLHNEVVLQALPGPLGHDVHASVTRIINAIHNQEVAQRELAHQASHDPLTELPNRAEAVILIEQALHRAQRSSTKTSLMFVDLDYFKIVNDTFGHASGDQVLRLVATRLLSVIRDGDNAARLGGDEFVVLLEDIDDEADIVRLGERIVEELSQDMLVDNHTVRIGASIGIAFCRDSYTEPDRLLQEADAAAYRAKSEGRGRVDVFDDGLRRELRHRADLELSVASGLQDDEFVLHYQPVIDLETGETIGVEALIRWEHPTRGLLAPDEFIPIAEQSALIRDVDLWVLRTATRQLVDWDAAGQSPDNMTLSVNIAGKHLAANEIMTDIAAILQETGIAAGRLILDVAETVLAERPLVTRNMQALRDLGVKIAIDDFGLGSTSISQLPHLPADSLKIDRTFISSATQEQQETVRLIVESAHAFGLTVVAEGVEQADQHQRLLRAGVEFGQGFRYARPCLAGELFTDVHRPTPAQ